MRALMLYGLASLLGIVREDREGLPVRQWKMLLLLGAGTILGVTWDTEDNQSYGQLVRDTMGVLLLGLCIALLVITQ